MNPATESPQRTAHVRRQKELTQRLGVLPARRSTGTNLKWSTWKRCLGMRGEATS